MNKYFIHSVSVLEILRSLKHNARLIFSLIKREISGRYRGSIMGIFWSLLTPMLMLAVYTFVFGDVFKSRWLGGQGSRVEFALALFAGLIMFNLFSEVVNRSPSLILSNVNYVKKVIFPLEILPIVIIGAAYFNLLVSLFVWLVFYIIFIGVPNPTILFLPLILIPLGLITLGLSWFLSSLGVFLRDVGQFIGVATTVLMFLSPVFYPMAALPEKYQIFMHMNPLTYVVEASRNIMMWDKSIDFWAWCLWTLFSCLVAWGGFAWFQKTRKGFADVL